MPQRSPASFRNTRKHFVKCVDCDCQTLPQNASKERAWTATASLSIAGRINDGALCFSCANKRRTSLGLTLEQGNCQCLRSKCERTGGTANESMVKTIRVNEREYVWSISTLETVLERWKDQLFYDEYKKVDSRWWRVVVNGAVVAADDFSSMPISDGDVISIVMGRGARAIRG